MSDILQIDRTTLQIVFDTAVGSMDFGSGFLDDEEVVALRALAVVLGVDQSVATPSNFRCKFYGHEWRRRAEGWPHEGAEANVWICHGGCSRYAQSESEPNREIP